MENREKAINFIKKNGPVLPIQISKHLENDLIFSSAILSELVSSKLIKCTKACIGSSPLYYLPGQEYFLGPKLYNHLKPKEREGYDVLRERKVIRDNEAEPWQRVVFRNIPDFAIPTYVTIKDQTEIFWRFYLISEDEARKYIEEILQSKKKEKQIKQQPDQLTLEEQKLQEVQDSKQDETYEKLHEEKPKKQDQEISPEKEIQTESKERKIPKKDKKEELQQKETSENISEFYDLIKRFLEENGIVVLEEETVRRNREFNFLVKVPSNVGALKYFLKAKNKKTINDAEIILAHSQSQENKLPCLFLTNGKLTKKAQQLIKGKLSGQFLVKKI